MLIGNYEHYRNVVLGWMLTFILLQLAAIIAGSLTLKKVTEFNDEQLTTRSRYTQGTSTESTHLIGDDQHRHEH